MNFKPTMKKTSNLSPFFGIEPIEKQNQTESCYMRLSNHLAFAFFFAYFMEGEALIEIDNKKYLLGAGQLILVPEHKSIYIHHFKNCVGFNGRFTIDFLKDPSYPVLRTQNPVVQSFWFEDAVFMGSLMKRMLVAYDDKDKAFLQSGLDLILGQLRPGGKIAIVPEKFLQLVFDRNKIPMSVSEYASMLNVTANYLNKTVKNHTHRTAIDWIEIARLNLAKQLLKDSSIPIVDVAFRTGLADQSYFSRFFKKKTGLSPSQFRNEQ